MKYGQWQEQFKRECSAHGGVTPSAALRYEKIYASLRDDGLSEEQAVDKLGPPDEAARLCGQADAAVDGENAEQAGRAIFSPAERTDELLIDCKLCEARIQFCDGGDIVVDYPAAAPTDYKVGELGGKVSVSNRGLNIRNFGRGRKLKSFLNVYIPRESAIDVKIKMFASGLKIDDGKFADLRIEMDGGEVRTGKLVCADADIRSDAGRVETDSLICHRLRADINAGRLTCAGVCGSTAEIFLNAATAKLGKIDCKRTEIQLSLGRAEAIFCGDRGDYDARVKRTLALTGLSERLLGRERSISARISLGRFDAAFANA